MRRVEPDENVDREEPTDPEENAQRHPKKSKKPTYPFEHTVHLFVEELRNQLMTAVNPAICDEAYGIILGNPDVDPGPRLSQLVWNSLARQPNTPPRPLNVPVTYELPPQTWPRLTERDLPLEQRELLVAERKKMETELLRAHKEFTKRDQPPALRRRKPRRN